MQMEALWVAQSADRQSPARPAAMHAPPLPGAMAPAVPQRGVLPPAVPQPGVLPPVVPQPGVLPPVVPQPGAVQPAVPQPGAVQPSAPQPGLVPPPAHLPGVAQPGAPRPAQPAQSQVWQTNLARLTGLGEVLAQHGLRTRLITPPGRVPSLHVVNPQACALAEDVYAGRAQDGLWWFWWSWAERITVGEDLEGAASRIKRVLAAS